MTAYTPVSPATTSLYPTELLTQQSNLFTNEDRNVIRQALAEKEQWGERCQTPSPAQAFMISAYDDGYTDFAEVPMQRVHVGTLAIPSSLASTPCNQFNPLTFVTQMNGILGTNYFLDATCLDLFNLCLQRNYDFGTAYAHLRPHWLTWTNLQKYAGGGRADSELADYNRRQSAMDNRKQIIDPDVPPRRLWDLYSNRVIPFWAAGARGYHIGAVSHAWVDSDTKSGLLQMSYTTINSYEWPVPIPFNTTLDRVRIELLNYGMEYVWLDVLCLRQAVEGSWQKERLREEEWLLDVPTIGSIYRHTMTTCCYYSGLGRPFHLPVGDLGMDRHWINRAWTVQEVSKNVMHGGLTATSPKQQNSEGTRFVKTFYDKLSFVKTVLKNKKNIYPLLFIMRQRASCNEVDKITSLAYVLESKVLPGYMSNQDPEDTWRRLIETMSPKYRGDLLFRYPVPGDVKWKWHPSWQQVKQLALPNNEALLEDIGYSQLNDVYSHHAYRKLGWMTGLGSSQSGRNGAFTIMAGPELGWVYIVTAHTQPIPDGQYTLIGSENLQHWVVGWPAQGSGRIEKASVVKLSPSNAPSTVDFLRSSLQSCKMLVTYA